MLARKAASPEITFPTFGNEILLGCVPRRFWGIPDLATEDPAKARNLETINFDDPAMKVTFRASEQVVEVSHFIRIMVAMDEPDVSQSQNGSECLLKRL